MLIYYSLQISMTQSATNIWQLTPIGHSMSVYPRERLGVWLQWYFIIIDLGTVFRFKPIFYCKEFHITRKFVCIFTIILKIITNDGST